MDRHHRVLVSEGAASDSSSPYPPPSSPYPPPSGHGGWGGNWNQRNAYLYGESGLHRAVFIATSCVYFVPLLIHGWTRVSASIALLGFISTAYHSGQCCACIPKGVTHGCMWADYAMAASLGLLIWYWTSEHLTPVWYAFAIGALALLLGANLWGSSTYYMLTHSMWHVVSAALLFYCSEKYHLNTKGAPD